MNTSKAHGIAEAIINGKPYDGTVAVSVAANVCFILANETVNGVEPFGVSGRWEWDRELKLRFYADEIRQDVPGPWATARALVEAREGGDITRARLTFGFDADEGMNVLSIWI